MLSAPSSPTDSAILPAAPAAPAGAGSGAATANAPEASFDAVLAGLNAPAAPAAPAAPVAPGWPLVAVPETTAELAFEGEAEPEGEETAEEESDGDATHDGPWMMFAAAPTPTPPPPPPVAGGHAASDPDDALESEASAGDAGSTSAGTWPAAPGKWAAAPGGTASPAAGGRAAEGFAVADRAAQSATSPAPATDSPLMAAEVEAGEGEPAPRADTRRSTDRALPTTAASPARHYAAAAPVLTPAAIEPMARSAGSAPFAGAPVPLAPAAGPEGTSEAEKMVQSVVTEVVHPALQTLGIDPAKIRATMEFVAPNLPSSTPEPAASSAESGLNAGAARTIERVLETADLLQGSERSSLNLRLDFGESGPLSVQITLREGRVHTLFRSDSADVREALGTAWNQFSQRGENVALPLAEPVMLPMRSSANGQGQPESGRQGDLSQHPGSDGQPGRQPGAAREDSGSPLLRGLRRRQAAAVAPLAAPRASSSSHLSVLA